MANPHRGEIEIKIGAETFNLCPTFQALCEFEEKAGITTFEAAQNLFEGKAPAQVMVSAVWAGIRGAAAPGKEDQCPSWMAVGQKMQSAGIPTFLPKVFQFLTNALASDEDIKTQEARLGNEPSEDSTTTE